MSIACLRIGHFDQLKPLMGVWQCLQCDRVREVGEWRVYE